MHPTIEKRVFHEPDGRPESLVYFGTAVAFLSMYVYFTWVLSSTDSFFFLLLIGVGYTLQGTAESRPKSRRRTAGMLRLMVILIYLCGLVGTVLIPEFMFG